MKRLSTILLGLSFALPVFALNFSESNLPYSDVRAGTAESAAISVLTDEGIVSGYPDGTFRPSRTLNRAEFLKIVLESASSLNVSASDAASCFPDMHQEDWFSRYVCFAKNHEFIGGYPDGTFKPVNSVNYAEALKMLSTMYGYELDHEEGDTWFAPYVRATTERGIALPVAISADSFVTRGQMARLTAAALSEEQGMLEEYRAFERGEAVSSQSSSTSSSSSSSVSSSSSSSLSSSSSSFSSSLGPFTIPLISHFLITGEPSDAIANGTTIAQGSRTVVTAAKITLFNEALSLSGIDLVSLDGQKIATLKRRTIADTSEYKKIYEYRELTSGSGFSIPANSAFPIIARTRVRNIGEGGASNQLVQVRSFTVTTFDPVSFQTYTFSFAPPFPQHQTAFGRITSVGRVGPREVHFTKDETNVLLGTFSFKAKVASGQTIALTALRPTVHTSGITLKNVRISSPSLPYDSGCSVSGGQMNCADLNSFGMLPADGSQKLFEIRADVTVDSLTQDRFVSVALEDPGLPNRPGALSWTDGSGQFNWVEGAAPLVQ